jgi:hypothetical protein
MAMRMALQFTFRTRLRTHVTTPLGLIQRGPIG